MHRFVIKIWKYIILLPISKVSSSVQMMNRRLKQLSVTVQPSKLINENSEYPIVMHINGPT